MSGTKEAVREGYARVAREDFSDRAQAVARIATAFGYGAEDLASLPDGANMGLSCGNPVALASLKAGETVVDLGSGGGLDVFLAARAVGPKGRAIGIDMTEEMVALAGRNAAAGGYTNVEFHLAPLEAMPLASESVDCVISNCVLNLVDDKDAALREVFRVLKRGGRLAISDIALLRALPSNIANDITAWVSCFAGAISIESNLAKLARAGFAHAQAVPTGADLNIYKEGGSAGCCGSKPAEQSEPSCCESKTADNAKDGCCTPKASPDAPGCCTPAPASEGKSACCASEEAATEAPADAAAGFHDRLTQSLHDLDLNAYAAAVRIFAVKP
jgi:SAM-dependent methyltransferase